MATSHALDASHIGHTLTNIRNLKPLVHNITNYVVMNSTANALLAVGASPVMAHAAEEVEEMVTLAQALVLNIGTLSQPWVRAMEIALHVAQALGKPVVLDPVGAGATKLRTETCLQLLGSGGITVVRGNASEILALCGATSSTRGVDSNDLPSLAIPAALKLSERYGCCVWASGSTDFIVDHHSQVKILNGHSMMSQVTGMGCMTSSLVGAALGAGAPPLIATSTAATIMGVCGELAAEPNHGTGSFYVSFLDQLSTIEADTLKNRLRWEVQ